MARIILVIVLLCFSLILQAYAVRVGNLATGEHRIRAVDKASGQELWRSTVKIQRTQDASGQAYLYISEKAEGRFNGRKTPLSLKSESYVVVSGDQLTPYLVKQTLTDRAGKVVRILTKNYNEIDRKVTCQYDGKVKTFDFYADLIDREMLSLVLADFPLDQKELKVHLLTHEPALYKITFRNRGETGIEVGGKIIPCYKIELVPDLGALNLVSGFFPKTYFYYTLKKPRSLVGYEGLESGPGTPYILIRQD